ncbi:hypothetical protein CsSME_00000291 [Camellia sinensis var. sinensis]
MERQAPYADHNVNPYAAAQMQQIALQRMQQNAGMSNFPGRPDSFISEKEHINMLSKEGHRHPMSSHPYSEGQGGNAARSVYEGQMPDPKVDSLKQPNMESGFQAHEQDMEIGYEDKPSTLTFEGLEQRFLDEIMKLAKEQSDAEDAENAKHREKIIQINTQYQEKLLSLRAQQAKRREEFLLKEAQARLHQYQQAGLNHHHPTNAGPIDPRGGYGGAAATEAHRAYATGQSESYRDRTPFLGGGRNQGTDARVPIPEGRVYNNTSARNY